MIMPKKFDNNMENTNHNESIMDFSIDDIVDFNIFEINNDEPLWDRLIQQIIDGNVIPVIGADLLIEGCSNLNKKIVDGLARKFEINQPISSFSELVYTPEYKNKFMVDNIYYQVDRIFATKRFPASERLRKFLSIRQFPFVITTSFTPVVEQVMRNIWEDELKVMKFSNNPAENNDIKDETDLRKPTIYYMFGKVGSGAHKYVLTDTDLLDFVSSWLSNDNKVRPKNLCNELKNKYLLMLGNTYSDWLFRFIWYSMRKSDLGHGMLAYDSLDESLIHFLERTKTFTKQNTSEVIDQILNRLNKKLGENEVVKFNKPQENTDVFISYSRSDAHIAEQLYTSLTKQGKRVWYDKYNLTEGSLFMEEINKAIMSTQYFIPILTSNIEKERKESHIYRTEWDKAIDVAISMGRTFIIPLAEKSFDFYKATIPDRIQKHNAIFYSSEEDINIVADKIIHKMNQD